MPRVRDLCWSLGWPLQSKKHQCDRALPTVPGAGSSRATASLLTLLLADCSRDGTLHDKNFCCNISPKHVAVVDSTGPIRSCYPQTGLNDASAAHMHCCSMLAQAAPRMRTRTATTQRTQHRGTAAVTPAPGGPVLPGSRHVTHALPTPQVCFLRLCRSAVLVPM